MNVAHRNNDILQAMIWKYNRESVYNIASSMNCHGGVLFLRRREHDKIHKYVIRKNILSWRKI